jgi:hypothetical protein
MKRAGIDWQSRHLSPHSFRHTINTIVCNSGQDPAKIRAILGWMDEADPLVCPRCSAPMRILAVITEPEEVRKILRHLVKIGRSPPGFDPASLN